MKVGCYDKGINETPLGESYHGYFWCTCPSYRITYRPPHGPTSRWQQVSVLLVINFHGRELLHLHHDPKEQAIKEKNTHFQCFCLCSDIQRVGIVGLTFAFQVVIVMFVWISG